MDGSAALKLRQVDTRRVFEEIGLWLAKQLLLLLLGKSLSKKFLLIKSARSRPSRQVMLCLPSMLHDLMVVIHVLQRLCCNWLRLKLLLRWLVTTFIIDDDDTVLCSLSSVCEGLIDLLALDRVSTRLSVNYARRVVLLPRCRLGGGRNALLRSLNLRHVVSVWDQTKSSCLSTLLRLSVSLAVDIYWDRKDWFLMLLILESLGHNIAYMTFNGSFDLFCTVCAHIYFRGGRTLIANNIFSIFLVFFCTDRMSFFGSLWLRLGLLLFLIAYPFGLVRTFLPVRLESRWVTAW